eukprot:1854005-Pyramimonas_sp.AAC.1
MSKDISTKRARPNPAAAECMINTKTFTYGSNPTGAPEDQLHAYAAWPADATSQVGGGVRSLCISLLVKIRIGAFSFVHPSSSPEKH